MNGVIPTAKRGFHVLNPRGRGMDAPKGMIHFSIHLWEKTSQIQKSKKIWSCNGPLSSLLWCTILVFEHSIGYRRNSGSKRSFCLECKEKMRRPASSKSESSIYGIGFGFGFGGYGKIFRILD